MLTQALRTQTELETSLKLARSNMQLALANNEMLEEALRRESASGSKDVGWHRRSDRPESRQGLNIRDGSGEGSTRPASRQGSLSITSTPTSESASPSIPTSPEVKSVASPPPPPQSAPAAPTDSRFFRFRFGSSSASTSPNPNAKAGPSRPRTPSLKKPTDSVRDRDASHLTSASLPSLVSDTNRREAELVAELEAERAARVKATTEKTNLEQEVESLSQALFEEANKMVAEERIRAAEILEELRQVRAEKEALRSAMQIIELENSRLKSPISETPESLSLVNDKLADDITPVRSRPPSMIRARSRSRGRSVEDVSSVSGSGKTRSDSPSSVIAFRHRSSSSERGWASSPPTGSHDDNQSSISEIALSVTTSDSKEEFPEMESSHNSSNNNENQVVESDKRQEDTPQSNNSLSKSSYNTLPIEESPWTRI